MAAPNIVSVTAVQDTGSIIYESVIKVTVNFTADHSCNFTVQISVDNGGNWYTALTHANVVGASYASGVNVPAGSAQILLIDTNTTFEQQGFPARGTHANTLVRVQATDTVDQSQSSVTATSAFSLKSTLPVISNADGPDYVNSTRVASITLTGHNGNVGQDPATYRISTNVLEIGASGSAPFNAFGTGTFDYTFAGSHESGSKTLYVRVYDTFYNASVTASMNMWLQKTGPADAVALIHGTTGSTAYTGIAIGNDGAFTPDRTATLQVSAHSGIPNTDVTFKILSSSQVVDDTNINTVITLDSQTALQDITLTTNPANPTVDDYDTDITVSVYVEFYDAAGNMTPATAQIRLNTRVYRVLQTNIPLRSSDANYRPMLLYVAGGGATTEIPRTITLSDSLVRSWPDIFYPTTHSYPKQADGTIDASAAIAMAEQSDEYFDAVRLQAGAVLYDEEMRPITTQWSYDKVYGPMTSATADGLQYWVLDVSLLSEVQLDFEYVDLDANVYGPPYNTMAPFRGDMLVLYDASAAGVLQQDYDAQGNPIWVIANSSLLEGQELYAWTGQGTNVMDILTGARMNSNGNGGFVSDFIRGVSKLCLILYSDASHQASGFKLRSSRRLEQTWVNYHIDYVHGELWIHMHEDYGVSRGSSGMGNKQLIYDWLSDTVDIDYDLGIVKFNTDQTGAEITVDYSYHDWNTASPPVNWIAAQDDFVNYNEAPIFIQKSDHFLPTLEDRGKVFEQDGYGRMITNYVWDKDRGVVEFAADTLPTTGQRVFADYYHHTYLRLSNDGYGDLTWNDNVIVADTTERYHDYTYTDVKIVNEGDVELEDAKFKFVPRGYDKNNDGQVIIDDELPNVVDAVLDINRPWDVQKGTKDETHLKMAVEIRANFTWDRSCTKQEAGVILGGWANHVYGDIAARSRVFGRCVWVLGGSGGSSYPETTAGQKRTSLEASGKYYTNLV